MLYRFRINVLIRTVLLALVLWGLIEGFQQDSWVLIGGFGLLTLFILFNLFYYVDQTNRDVTSFLTSIKYNDFTATATAAHRGASFGQLYQGFNVINKKFQEVRADREANHQFLQTIVEHIDIGLLCYNQEGEVVLMNKALQRLLHKSFLLHIDGLQAIDPELWEAVKASETEQRDLIKVTIDNRLLQLSIQSAKMRMQNELLYLVSFQNIQSELEAQELEAWQKLIRILTHEIMNSVAPITSLSGTIKEMMAEPDDLSPADINDIRSSIGVIQRRGEGLLDFTETYRTLTRIPPPNFQLVEGDQLLKDAEQLFRTEAEERGLELIVHLPPSPVSLQGDPHLLEQVLINLVKNAMDATTGIEQAQVHLHLNRGNEGRAFIQVADNGQGMSREQLEQIFVPFFTTKDHGSGIGLSLSRQIMRLHKGSIEVQSVEGEGTVMSLLF